MKAKTVDHSGDLLPWPGPYKGRLWWKVPCCPYCDSEDVRSAHRLSNREELDWALPNGDRITYYCGDCGLAWWVRTKLAQERLDAKKGAPEVF